MLNFFKDNPDKPKNSASVEKPKASGDKKKTRKTKNSEHIPAFEDVRSMIAYAKTHGDPLEGVDMQTGLPDFFGKQEPLSEEELQEIYRERKRLAKIRDEKYENEMRAMSLNDPQAERFM